MKFKDFHEAEEYVNKTVHKYLDDRGIFEPLLVLIRQRHKDNEKYEYLKELVLIEDCSLVWEYDWNEGQSDVDVIAIIPIDEIEEFSYIENKEAWEDYKKHKN